MVWLGIIIGAGLGFATGVLLGMGLRGLMDRVGRRWDEPA